MYRLLDKNHYEKVNLLTIVYKNSQKNSYTYYANMINSDPRTLFKIVAELETDISQNHWEDFLHITHSEKGLTFFIGNNFSLNYFFSFYMRQSVCYKLCYQILLNKYQTLERFADSVFMSKATLYRKLQPLKEILKEFTISLDLASKNLFIGEEHNIRYFFYSLFWETFQSSQPFYKEFPHLRKQILHLTLSAAPYSYTIQLKCEIIIAISLMRMKKDRYIDYLEKEFQLPNINIPYKTFHSSISQLLSNYPFIPEKQYDLEINFLNFILTSSNIYPKEYYKEIPIQFFDFNEDSKNLALRWIFYFCDFFNTSISTSNYFYLLTNLIYIQTRARLLPSGSTYLGLTSLEELIKNDEAFTYYRGEDFIIYLETQNEDFFIDSHTSIQYITLVKELLLTLNPPLKILVISKISYDHQKVMEEKIRKSSYTPIEFQENFSTELDLVISDFPLNYEFLPIDANKHFQWLTFPLEFEWKNLLIKLESLYFNQKNYNHSA